MDSLFELSESSLHLDDIMQIKTKAGQGALQSSILGSQGLQESQYFRDSIFGFGQKLATAECPEDLQDAFSTLPSGKTTDEARRSQSKDPAKSSLQSIFSQNSQASHLANAVASCEQQIQVFKHTVMDAQGIMKELTNKWATEKEQAEELTEQLNLLKKMPSSGKHISVQTAHDHTLESLREKNHKLAQQVQRNAEVFGQLSSTLRTNSELEALILQKDKQVQQIKAEKERIIHAVETLVNQAQSALLSPGSDKKQKLVQVIRLMASLNETI